MKIEFEISDKTLNRILKYGEKTLEDLSEEDLKNIAVAVAEGCLERIIDEPHYAYDDYIEDVI